MKLTFFCAILTALPNLLVALVKFTKISGTCPNSSKDIAMRSVVLRCTENQIYVCLNMRGKPDDEWFESCIIKGKNGRFTKGTRPIFDSSHNIDTDDCPFGRFQNTSYRLGDKDVARCPYSLEQEKTGPPAVYSDFQRTTILPNVTGVTEDSGTHAAGLIVVVVVVVEAVVIAVIIVICCCYWRNHRRHLIKNTTENYMTSDENYNGSMSVDLSKNHRDEAEAMIMQPTGGDERTNEESGTGEAEIIDDINFGGSGSTEPLKRVLEV